MRAQTRKRAKVDPLLEGLNLTRTGEYVKVDDQLLNRLNQNQPSNVEPKPNPFEEYPDFMQTIRSGTPLSLEFLEECSQEMKKDPQAVKMAEMIGNFPVDWLALKRSKMLEDNWDYSVKIPINPRVTNQWHSGRCWAMAAYNHLRIPLIQKYKLEDKFEFSEAYLFFYDKIERSNMFLEYIWTLRDRDLTDRNVKTLTSPSSHFISDGGFFTYFLNLVSKYGLVPKNIYDEGYNSMVSDYINQTLITVLNHMALDVFQNDWSREEFETIKQQNMKKIYDLVVRFLGEPPKPTDTFTWRFRDEHGESHSIKNLTPEKFYRTVVPHTNDTKMVIINDPRHPETYYMSSWSPYSVNMQGGMPITMINLPLEKFKKLIYESLENEESVWFASDIGKCFDYESNTSDPGRFDYESVLGTDLSFSKADMLDMHTAVPNHAMLFIGVDPVKDSDGNVLNCLKWRVENSWGMDTSLEDAKDHGYYRMSDEYVDRYVFEAVVDLKYFDQESMEKIMENAKAGRTYTYDPYDAFGSLSLRSDCKHCHNKMKKRNFV